MRFRSMAISMALTLSVADCGPRRPPPDQARLLKGIRSVRIELAETYEGAEARSLRSPMELSRVAAELMRALGFTVADSEVASASAVLRVVATARPLVGNYEGLGKYTGATCDGTITIRLPDSTLTSEFHGNVPLSDYAESRAYNSPKDTPFYACGWASRSFAFQLLRVVRDYWGYELLAPLSRYRDWRAPWRADTVRAFARMLRPTPALPLN
jgi:hypothetical protein